MLEHRFAILTAAAAFCLLLIGGTVNPTGSSLACPEWTVICKGEFFPEMTGGVLYEHGHRLFGMLVGFLQITLTVLLWKRRPATRMLAVLSLVMVCVQGALGAITVGFKLPWMVSTAHLWLAMIYLATLSYIAWRTRVPTEDWQPAASLGGARRWIAVAAAFVLAQILLGGVMRHHEAALASVDLPLHEGSFWPADAPLPLQLHMAHRIGGVVVALVVFAAAFAVLRRAGSWQRLRRLVMIAPLLVVLQVALGLYVIYTFRSVPVAVAHFAGAAALWALWWNLFLMTGGVEPAPLAKGKTA